MPTAPSSSSTIKPVRTPGVSVFTRKLNALPGLRSDLAAYASALQANFKRYPPPRPNTTYKRTGDLRDGWQISEGGVTQKALSFTIEVFNEVQDPRGRHYAGYVMGLNIFEPGTSDMQSRGWRNWEAVALGMLNRYRGRMKTRLRKA